MQYSQNRQFLKTLFPNIFLGGGFKHSEPWHRMIRQKRGQKRGFKHFFIFTPTWGNDPIWLIFFKWVEPPTSFGMWKKDDLEEPTHCNQLRECEHQEIWVALGFSKRYIYIYMSYIDNICIYIYEYVCICICVLNGGGLVKYDII